MPPNTKVKKEDILNAAVQIIREKGAEALNARAISDKLGTSTQPIFSNYDNMAELKADVISFADDIYQKFLKEGMDKKEYPKYKASGMSYIRFAKEERELFKLLFMRDRTGESISENKDGIRPILQIVMRSTGLDEKTAYIFHLQMWIYVHGIATMMATGYLEWDWEMVSQMITNVYRGLKEEYSKGGGKRNDFDKNC